MAALCSNNVKIKMQNVFDNSVLYRDKILQIPNILKDTEAQHTHEQAKSFICVFPTKFCGVGCEFCFFASPNSTKAGAESRFSEEGSAKFIQFANAANVGYLQISGGGEPFHQLSFIVDAIKNTPSA